MSEESEFLHEILDLELADFPSSSYKKKIERTKAWLDRITALDYEINAKADEVTKND